MLKSTVKFTWKEKVNQRLQLIGTENEPLVKYGIQENLGVIWWVMPFKRNEHCVEIDGR